MTNTFTISDILTLLKQNWRRAAKVAGGVFIISILYAFLAPKWYTAQLSAVPMGGKSGGGLQQLVGGAASAALDLPIDLGMGNSDAERIAAVLKSNSVADKVIEKFDLKRRYREDYLEDAREALWEHCSTKVDKKPGVVTLMCEDKSPQMVKEMVDFFGEYGNQIFRRVSTSSATEEARFLGQRVAQARQDLDGAASRLREFQENNRIVDISEQAKAVIAEMASIKADLLTKEMQLSFLNSFSGHGDAATQQLQQQIAVLGKKLQMLEDPISSPPSEEREPPLAEKSGKKLITNKASVFPSAMAVPKLRYHYEQLFREQKIQEAVFLLLMQRYEMAKVNEARDTSVFQILDYPTVPTKKSRPHPSVILILGLMLALMAGVGSVLAPPCWRQFRNNLEKIG